MSILFALAITAVAAPAAAVEAPQATIEAMMRDSAAAWNTGDLSRFVAVYADDAIYVSGGELVSGKPQLPSDTQKSSRQAQLAERSRSVRWHGGR